MKILTIDVTGQNLIVAAYDGKNIVSRISANETKRHNSLVLPYVDAVLNELGMTIKDIDVFSCVIGPGSFTGIRIGIATIKAFAFANKKPCVSINALEALAYNKNDEQFYVTIDAKNNNCYAAKYQNSWENEILRTYSSYEKLEKDNIKIYRDLGDIDANCLIEITIKKANNGDFSSLEPLYLRKSQAEREKDGD